MSFCFTGLLYSGGLVPVSRVETPGLQRSGAACGT